MNTSADSDNDNGEDETWPLQPRSAGVNGLLTTLVILVALTALVGNTLVILAVFLYRRLKDEVANLFIVNLSITDLSSAIVVMLSSAAAVGADRWVMGDVWCSIVCGTNYCLIIVSMLTLCFISLDRYVAIHHSLRYHHLVTRSRIFLLLLYSWLQGLSFGLVPVLCGWVRYDYWEATCAISWHLFGRPVLIYVIVAFIFCFFLPSVVLAVAYCKVLRTTQKIQPRPRPTMQLESLGHPFCQDGPTLSHSGVASFRNSHSRVAPLHNGVAPSPSRTAPSHSGAAPSHSEDSPSHNEAVISHHGAAPSNSESSPSHSGAPSHRPAELARWPQRRPKYSESSKAVRSLLIVMLAYFVCLTPFSVTKLYKVIVSNPSGLPGYASLLATFFQYLSSVVNPLIYGLFRRDFQKAFLYLLRSVRYRRSDISSNHHSSGSF